MFTELLGVEVEIITNRDEVYTREFIINYSNQDVAGFQIIPDKILFQKGIVEQNLKINSDGEFVKLFENGGDDISFDILGASFFLLSRYEEYLPHKRDKHDRFSPEYSVAYKNDFLDQPIINVWVEHLKSLLSKKYPSLQYKKTKFEFVNTIDVDYAYAYKEKGAIRAVGGLTRDFLTGKFGEFANKLKCYLGLIKDPFDTFDFVLDLHKTNDLKSIFFFHVGDYDVHDKSIPVSSNRLQALVKGVNDYADIGLHPSYASCLKPEKLSVEFSRLSKLIHQPVVKSRFHFIKVNLPQSYRELIENEVTEDYTMGYASKMGFRAGVCNPFYFYDLDFDSPTNLRVYPFYLMEATIKYYFEEGPEKAFEYFKKYIDIVKEHNGTFTSLWHNDSFSEWGIWRGWKSVYEEMIAYVVSVKNND
ncbi:MAG: polysaccharide deacetylase family protein [Salibacteraceae bacterium]